MDTTIRRLTAIAALLIGLCLHAFAQSPEAVTLDLSKTTLQEALDRVQKQTGVTITFSPQSLSKEASRKVSLKVSNVSLKVAMDRLLEGTGMTYTISGKQVMITKAGPVKGGPVTIHGTVVDEAGEPLPGVTIRLKGSNRGTTANVDGSYKLDVPNIKTAVLVFSLIGMKTEEVKPKSATVNMTLREAAELLGEVLVESTGYQDTEKRLSTSSVVTIDASDVLTADAGSVDQMLSGKIPGLTVLGDVSTPGAAAKIRVRGVSTLSGSRDPLWVVDGIILDDPVPLSAEEINSLDNVNLIGNAISGLNPMDIEKIDVLKDAAATAIYGVRAANGVIVVTTKKGSGGRFAVNYSGSVTYNQRPNYGQMALMNSKERIEVSKEIEERGLPFLFRVSRVGYEGLLMDLYDRKLTEDQFLQGVKALEENNTDWFDLLFRDTASQRHNLSLSGGNDKATYYASGSVALQPDLVKGKGVNNYNGMLKINFRPSKQVTAQVQFRVNGSDKNYTYMSVSPYAYALRTSRAIAAYDDAGERLFYNNSMGYLEELRFNMMHEMEHTGNTVKGNGYNAIAFLEYRPILDLKLNTTFGLNMSNTQSESWFDEQSYEAAKMRRLNYGSPLPDTEKFRKEMCTLPYGGMMSTNNMRNLSWQWRAQLIYNLRRGPHVLSINTGPELRSVHYTGISSKEYGYLPERGQTFMYIDPTVWLAYKKMAEYSRDRMTNSLSNFVSLFANLTYTYDRRYIATFNVRAEGSNKFGQDPKARFLPIWSLSARWNAHEEDFLKDVNWLNLLSFKGSYGIQGNVSDDQTPSLIMRFGEYESQSEQFQSHISKLPNPNLRWEKNTSWNAGFETALFDNRLTFSVDYYQRIGTDQLINKVVSHTLGRTNIQLNAGTLVNKGLDFMATMTPIRTKDWTWTLNVNGSHNENIVTDGGINTDYTYLQLLNGSVIRNGESVNTFYSYRFKGLTENGLPDFYGIEPPKEGETREDFFARAFVNSGSRIPIAQGGMGTSLRWKDLTLNLFFSYSVGNKVRLNDLYNDGGQTTPKPQENLSSELVDRWRQPGDETKTNIPAISSNKLDDVKSGTSATGEESPYKYEFARNRWQMYNKSDLRVVSGSHVRLRSASLVYRFRPELLEKTGFLRSANVRLEGYNLLLFASKDLHGQDPSQVTLGSRTTPPLPSFAVTVNLGF